MWIASGSGVKHNEQGITSGMASTTLNVGNALLIALSASGAEILQQETSVSSLENALQPAFYLATTGQVQAYLSPDFYLAEGQLVYQQKPHN